MKMKFTYPSERDFERNCPCSQFIKSYARSISPRSAVLDFVWGINPYKMKKPTLLLMMFSLLIIRAITVWRYPARYFRIVITATRQLVKVKFINKRQSPSAILVLRVAIIFLSIPSTIVTSAESAVPHILQLPIHSKAYQLYIPAYIYLFYIMPSFPSESAS